ncbi:hypothetical protein [uncultured Treponema sp.]|uniref:hypothetical protein n=1 Tax=uncultured Treponema sp. TaxID=162155 RepID=UPI0025EB911A|nr:hypothetical protein [uncultured Treponema sp.]
MIKDFVKVHEKKWYIASSLWLYRYIRYYLFKKVKFFWFHTPFFLPFSCQKKLRLLKKTYSGRCFIIGTGPSLTLNDLNKLDNEIVFGANSLCTIVGDKFRTTITSSRKPWYYGFQDDAVWLKYSDIIETFPPEHVFYNTDVLYRLGKKNFKIWKTAVPFHSDYHGHAFRYGHSLKTGFAKNAAFGVHDGYTILYSLLQISVFMGFSEVYLLGADCNYNQQQQHSVLANKDQVNDGIYKYLSGPSMIASYKVAKKWADKHGIKIYNATRGGMLDVFPRVDLDEVLKQ